MTAPWPPQATDEEREMRLFKDALMRRSMSAVGALLSSEGEEELHRRTAEVEDAYTRVSEHAPEDLKGDDAPGLRLPRHGQGRDLRAPLQRRPRHPGPSPDDHLLPRQPP